MAGPYGRMDGGVCRKRRKKVEYKLKRFLTIYLLLALLLSVPALALSDEEMDAAAQEAAEKAVAACAAEDMTDLETLTALHDWMALHCDYGASPRSGTAYGALAEGSAVCTGYAAGYACLAAAAGLDGVSTYSAEIDHAWILATLDGTRYFSDCTWDDGKNQKLGLIRHKYFLFNEGNAAQTGHLGWDSAEFVPGGALEAVPWTAAVTRVIFDGDYAYYFDSSFRLIRCDRATWQTEVLLTLSDRWPDLDRTDGKTPEIYSGLVLLRGRLYFNTPERICYYDLAEGTVKTAVTPDTSAGCIYGVGVENGRLCYSLAESESAVLYDVIDTGISARTAWGY